MREDFKERHKQNFWNEITSFGGYVFPFSVFLTFILIGEFNFAKRYFFGIIIIYLAAFAIRYFYFKPRPDRFIHSNLLEKLDASSFPSLHAARSAFVFAMVSSFIGSILFSIFASVMVILTCYSRLRLRRHDVKDVTAGIVLGVLVFLALM